MFNTMSERLTRLSRSQNVIIRSRRTNPFTSSLLSDTAANNKTVTDDHSKTYKGAVKTRFFARIL